MSAEQLDAKAETAIHGAKILTTLAEGEGHSRNSKGRAGK